MKLEKEFNIDGFNCWVKINDSLGFRCDYVNVPSTIDYDFIDGLDCHGGITYKDENNGVLTIGFDCGHYGDGVDPNLIAYKKYVSIMKRLNLLDTTNCKSLEFCEEECHRIVNQIKEYLEAII